MVYTDKETTSYSVDRLVNKLGLSVKGFDSRYIHYPNGWVNLILLNVD